MGIDLQLQRLWYGKSRLAWLLLPFSWIFGALFELRRWCFARGLFKRFSVGIPVIVVGNLTVGGTGKTPLVIWLANSLFAQKRKVAVITRGYGGQSNQWPQRVKPGSDPVQVGDEAVLIAQQTQAIVIAGPDRVANARQAIAEGAELILSDDGLQHYRMQRDLELVVVDNSRMFGNGFLLPAGPLREPVKRLQEADLVLLNQRDDSRPARLDLSSVTYRIRLGNLRALKSEAIRAVAELNGQTVHVITAIGHPQSFISALEQLGLHVDARILPDHARLSRADIEFNDDLPVLMTEKDAVKCQHIADSRHWAVTTQVQLSTADEAQLIQCVQRALQINRGIREN